MLCFDGTVFTFVLSFFFKGGLGGVFVFSGEVLYCIYDAFFGGLKGGGGVGTREL